MSNALEVFVPSDILPPMTAEEARQAVQDFLERGLHLRWLLLDMYERKAHIALHHTNFEDFAEKELHLVLDKSTLSNLVRWARIERNVLGTAIANINSDTTGNFPKLPRLAAFEIARLPTVEDQRKAWNEFNDMQETSKSGYISAGYAMKELKHIVTRMLNNSTAPETSFDRDARRSSSNNKPKPSPTQSDVTPTPTSTTSQPFTQTTTTVSSFTPPPDADPDEEKTEEDTKTVYDFPEWHQALCTLMAWVDNEEIDGDRKTRLWAIGCMTEISEWVENM